MDAEAELLDYMRQFGLDPGAIQWDRKIHRFQGPGDKKGQKSAWYRAFEDGEGAVFGSWKDGPEQEVWQARHNGVADPRSREEVERERKERAAEAKRMQERHHAEVAEKARGRWARAERVEEDHPYLRAKSVTPYGVRQLGSAIVVPRLYQGELVNLERIFPDGDKRPLTGGKVKGTYFRIGSPEGSETAYLCEGYATAATIHEVTGAFVWICFNVDNMASVAGFMKEKLPGHRIIIAADNDRWSTKHYQGRRRPNPGVTVAYEVAGELGLEVAIPQFQDLEGRPTDFNDLMLRHGAEAVNYYLDPKEAEGAEVVDPEVVEVDPEPEPEPGEGPPSEGPGLPPEDWIEAAPFRVLGFNRDHYYYLPKGTGVVRCLSPNQHENRPQLLTLAPRSWWETFFPAQNGISWQTAADSMIQAAHEAGVFDPTRLRGRGCWREDDGVVLHLGDRMVVPGERRYIPPSEYASPGRYTYEHQAALTGPAQKLMEDDEAAWVLETLRSLLWDDPSYGDLLAGWVVLAPICGALTWRPHVWLTGERGCGKSTIVEYLVQPLLANLDVSVVGQSTEAGIRQELQSDARPVIFDEAEEDEYAGRRIQGVLALARQSSSETVARTVKGTTHGSSLQFRIRSMFLLASIGGAVHQEADRSRVTMLQLQGATKVSAEERHAHWERFQPRLAEVSKDMGRRLLARTMKLLRAGVVDETVQVFRAVAGRELGDQRMGDQLGTLYAGSWLLEHDRAPSEEEARERVGAEDALVDDDSTPEGVQVVQTLMQQRERVETSDGPRTLSVGELAELARGTIHEMSGPVSAGEAQRLLRQLGLRVGVRDGITWLYVAHSSEWIASKLAKTIHSRNWKVALQGLPGSESAGPVRFAPGHRVRATRVQLDSITSQ